MDDEERSVDDVLEEARSREAREDTVGRNALPEDNDPPAAPVTGLDEDEEAWLDDTDVDVAELYDEGP